MEVSVKTFEEIKALLEVQVGMLGRQRGIIGSSLFEALPFLEGWAWVVDRREQPQLLTRGAQRTRILDWQNERGWVIAGYIMFSDPDAMVQLTIDNMVIRTSPRGMSNVTQLQVGLSSVQGTVYDPSIGPQYGILVGAFQPLPYKSQVYWDAWLPATALNATAYMWFYALSKVLINNEKLWYESLERLGVRETQGKKGVKPIG